MQRSVGRLVSVNVGMPQDVEWRGRTVRTAVWKEPVDGPVTARRLNLDGDGQGDLAGHGGEHRAVFVYQLDSYRHWQTELSRDDFVHGQFGENFTVDGLADDEVCIGDRYRIGAAEFEVTQPRVTCYRVGIRMDDPRIPALLVSHRRPGFYLRVLREGAVRAGDEIVQVAAGPEAVTVAEVDGLLYLPGHQRDQLARALRVPALSAGWKDSLRCPAEPAGEPRRVRGQRGSYAGQPATGLARLPLDWRSPPSCRRAEPWCRLSLADPDGSAAAGRTAGSVPDRTAARQCRGSASGASQLLAVGASRRSRAYRISVKLEPHGSREPIHPFQCPSGRHPRRGRAAGHVQPPSRAGTPFCWSVQAWARRPCWRCCTPSWTRASDREVWWLQGGA